MEFDRFLDKFDSKAKSDFNRSCQQKYHEKIV